MRCMVDSESAVDLGLVGSKYAQKKVFAIEAAAEVFAQKGFHGATTQDIAEAMGIKQGSLYYYFKSSKMCVNSILVLTCNAWRKFVRSNSLLNRKF